MAFDVAIQQKNYEVAEHILRDLSLKEAVQKGVKPAESLLDRPLLKRVNSADDLTAKAPERQDAISCNDDWESASVRPQHAKSQKDEQLQRIREKYNIDDAGKYNLALTDAEMIKI